MNTLFGSRPPGRLLSPREKIEEQEAQIRELETENRRLAAELRELRAVVENLQREGAGHDS